MKMKKALLTVLCAVALVVSTVFGTLAYLTDDDAVTNTFTVGKVDIKLDEAKVGTDGKPVDSGERTETGNEYHLIPGQTYTKDPTVSVEAKSEEAYYYMTVTVTNIEDLESALPGEEYYSNDVFLIQNLCDWQANSKWQYVGYQDITGTKNGEYRFVYSETPAGGDNGITLDPLFNTITVPGKDITSDNIGKLDGVQIDVKAYAVQKAGFNTYDEAWSASYGDGVSYTITSAADGE